MRYPLAPLLAALAAAPLPATEYAEPYLYPDCRRPMPAEVDPVDWFAKANLQQRYRIRQNSRQHYADAHTMAERFLRDPQDDEAFYVLSEDAEHINNMLQELAATLPRPERRKLSTLLKYRAIHQAVGISSPYAQQQRPRREFVLRLRDLLQQAPAEEELLRSLYRMLEEESALSHTELDILCRGLSAWCGVNGSFRTAGAAARLYLREFRNGVPVRLSPAMEHDMCTRYPHLRRFVLAERALNGNVALHLSNSLHWEARTLNTFLWSDTPHALTLARHLGRPGYELLKHRPDTLRRYMRYCGITHYRAMGQEVPECCTTALDAHSHGSQARSLVEQQLQALEPELAPLAPRCLLALGQPKGNIWKPVKLNAATRISPTWPDASAVQLPMWSDSLLGLKKAESLPAAFDSELAAFAKLADSVKQHRGTGYILAAALRECEQARPRRFDLVPPVYHRIALHFGQDGITLSYLPEQDDFDIVHPGTNDPLLRTALHSMPQHLHRLTLLLALLEKQGKTRELENACNKLALALNRNELWPLVICQRELRGFSPRALLCLFAHYEGEDSALFDYGEAMGLRHEMSVARPGHEDELGDNLLRAACISRALPATAQQRQQAVAEFMQLAQVGAEEENERLTGGILSHLLRHGEFQSVLSWQDCPPQFLRGRYASNGLRLIRYCLEKGLRKEAERILATMRADADTDTTPACRLAQALLCNTAEEAARLRLDALLLAMLYRHIDYCVYEDYLDTLAEEGDAEDYIMRAELHFSNGRDAGLSPRLGFCYARHGRWSSAAFVLEYMLTQGLTTTTPYGTTPDHAHMYYYRAYADICRSRAENKPELAKQALKALAGTPAEHVARELLALPEEHKNATPKPQVEPLPSPREKDLLAALPTRSWKRKDGSTLEGQLIALTRRSSIRLRLADGSARTIPMSDIAGNEKPYFDRWSKANNITTWEWLPSEINPRYKVRTAGRPVCARPDFGHAGEWHMSVVDETGTLHHLRTWGLRGAQQQAAKAFCQAAENELSAGLCIAATPQEALKQSAEKRLPILIFSHIATMGARDSLQGLTQYLMLHPEAAAVWGQQYILLAASAPESEARPLRYSEQYRRDLLELEQHFNPGATAANAQTARMLDTTLARRGGTNICILAPGQVRACELVVDLTLPADKLLHNTRPLPETRKSPRP